MNALLNWRLLDRKVRQCAEKHSISAGLAFTRIALQAMFDITDSECDQHLTDGPGDQGIDAVYIEESGDVSQIHIMQCKWHDNFKEPLKAFPAGKVAAITAFLNDLLNNPQSLSVCNPALREKCDAIHSILDEGIACFHVHLCSNGAYIDTAEKTKLTATLDAYGNMHLKEYGQEDFVNLFVSNRRPNIEAKIYAHGPQIIEKSDGNIRGIVFVTSGEEVVRLITVNDKKTVRDAVFHDNIRMSLGYKSNFNENIYESAVSDQNHMFWYLNNGLTIMCDGLEFQKNMRNSKVHMQNVQIVNGRQTAQALFDAYQISPKRVAKTEVLVRVYATRDERVSFEVAVATNSQNRINARNLKSRDKIQSKLKEFFNDCNLKYQRLPHEFDGIESEKIIDSFRLGQVCMSYFLKYPQRARTGSDQIFDSYYDQIFHARADFDEYLAAYRLYGMIDKQCHSDVYETRKNDDRSLDFLSYAGFSILYGFRVISERDNISVHDLKKDFHARYREVVREIESLFSKEKTSSYQFFRDAKTRNRLRRALLKQPLMNSRPDLFDSAAASAQTEESST